MPVSLFEAIIFLFMLGMLAIALFYEPRKHNH